MDWQDGFNRVLDAAKARPWILNLVFALLGAYFSGDAASAWVAQKVYEPPTTQGRPRQNPTAPTSPSGRSTVALGIISERNLLGAMREDVTPPDESEAAPTEILSNDYTESQLRPCTQPLAIRGTLFSPSTPEWSMAILYINKDRDTQIFNILEGTNKPTPESTIIEIRERAVVLRLRDHFELCTAEEEDQPTQPPPEATASDLASPGLAEEVVQQSDTEYRVDGQYLDSQLSNLSQVATQARVVPSFKDGKANGFKMFSIRPGSIYEKIGMKNGDIIRKINGFDMDSPEKALELYQKLKDARNVTVELERGGVPKTMTYGIDR